LPDLPTRSAEQEEWQSRREERLAAQRRAQRASEDAMMANNRPVASRQSEKILQVV
jgi:hypothetical protein